MSNLHDEPDVSPATLRQRRRRQRLRELNSPRVQVLLTEEQDRKVDALLTSGYAPDKSSVLAKSLDEAFAREIKPKSGAKAKIR
jgi:hypothetical protein